MLLSLSIKDLVLIDTLHLSVESSLSVLTGETGAGKSILLDALGLALGMRGDVSLIRQGAEQAVVSAEFSIKDNSYVTQLLEEHGLAEEGGICPEILVFRRILNRAGTSSGRSRAFINEQMVSVGLLRLLGDALLEIHGQFDRLLDPTSYRLLLDEFSKVQTLRDSVRVHYHAWQQEHRQWQEAESNLAMVRQNEDFLKTQLEELKKLNPVAGEEDILLKEREELAHIGKLNEAIRDATGHLQTPPIESALHGAVKSLQRVQGQGNGKVEAAIAALEHAVGEVVEASAQIQEIAEQLANQPRRLLEIDERLYVLRAAARKYGVMGDDLVTFRNKLVEQLSSLAQSNDMLAAHAKAAADARALYHTTALDLHRQRLEGAQILEQVVMTELPALMLPQAQFKVQVTEVSETQWGEFGLDRIDFMVVMNKGQEFCSLSKSASGGELARFMLALKVALASRSAIPTIIFDEIDTGVGGAVAAAIGERLKKLSHDVQVLSITHSPQLAAYADTHFLVFKEDQGPYMRTSVRCLSVQEREDELARMLSGAEITVEARAAAQRLMVAR
ncbi:MAG: DNA repair protein RecN [Alphaproteobacteria bacterium]|jgi:DNA repair protein RecN (Recombination protein N)|nr:DNA repair protein RecN [Alphaproteobacteria bacterium]